MLHEIKSTNPASSFENAVDLLIACHERIRHFSSMLRKLAHAEGATDEEIRNAAGSALRYFSIALPLHEADEEESVRPRLIALSNPEITGALEAMTHQHQAVDDLVERLSPVLRLLSHNPAKLPDVHAELCSLSAALQEVFEGHLALEESVIFPFLHQQLSPEALTSVLGEMQQRRKHA